MTGNDPSKWKRRVSINEALQSGSPKFEFTRPFRGWTTRILAAVLGIPALAAAIFFILGQGDAELEIEGVDALSWVRTNAETGRQIWTLRMEVNVQKKWGVALSDCSLRINGNQVSYLPSISRFVAGQRIGADVARSFYRTSGRNTAQLFCRGDVSNLVGFEVKDVTPPKLRQSW